MSVTTPHPKRWAILGFMCLALVVTGLDSLIVRPLSVVQSP